MTNLQRGSIPACTGKPGNGGDAATDSAVYPRMYGETWLTGAGVGGQYGLSPHVRGNHERQLGGAQYLGSIPACTGKPSIIRQGGLLEGVYPRMYGETAIDGGGWQRIAGLSPHVRGNPSAGNGLSGGKRSIPACTGKPPQTTAPSLRRRVYPRMYGETSRRKRSTARRRGLSPHVRGNPRRRR